MTRTLVASTDLVIEVTGPGAGALFRLEQDWDVVNAALLELVPRAPDVPPVSAPPPSQALLLLRSGAASLCVHPLLAGRVYCRNIFVNIDRDLTLLGLTVNLDCRLQRDRHELPQGLPEIIGGIVKALAGQHQYSAKSSDKSVPVVTQTLYTAFCAHLLSAFRNHPTELHAFAPTMREPLRVHAAALAGCKPRNVVFLRDSEQSGEGLAGLGLQLLPNSGELSDRSNERDILLARVSRLPPWVPLVGSRQAVRVHWFDALLLSITGLGGWGRFRLCVVGVSNSAPFVRLAHADQSNLRCYVSSQLIENPQGWRQMAQLLSIELMCYLLPLKYGTVLSQLIAYYMQNPIVFALTGWNFLNHGADVMESMPLPTPSHDVAPSASTLPHRQTHLGAVVVESEPPSTQWHYIAPPVSILHSTQTRSGESVGEGDTCVRVPPCGGALLAFPGAPPPDGDFIEPPPPCACIPPLCRLVTRSICVPGAGETDRRTLYVDSAVMKEAETAGGPLETVMQSMPVLLRRFDAIVRR